MEIKEAKVGQIGNENAKVLRIVHISDTHMAHNAFLDNIPMGDILIHSGDFGSFKFKRYFGRENDFNRQISDINDFFGKCPHKHKIFVAGNHETNFSLHSPQEIQARLTNGIYLQDSSVLIEGIKIYGSPWNNNRWYSYASAFAKSYDQLRHRWTMIPRDVDILVTHLPPHGILDLASLSPWKKLWRGEAHCDTCDVTHQGGRFLREHWGCPHLRKTVDNLKPLAHLFGHVHGCNGLETHGDIIFSNAALKCQPCANVIDVYTDSKTSESRLSPEYASLDLETGTCGIL